MPKAKLGKRRFGIHRRKLELYSHGLAILPPKIQLFTRLVELNISYNNLLVLDGKILPTTLQILNCANNRLKVLENLHEGLLELYCWWNDLVNLDNLPTTLVKLRCCHNSLEHLNYLPPGLRVLYCLWNKLNRLDFLPVGLRTLACGSNPLQELRNLPPNLREIDIPPYLLGLTYYQSLQNLDEFNKRRLVELPPSIVEVNGKIEFPNLKTEI